MEIIIRNYKISPYSGNTCWKIQERQDKDGMKAEWKEPNYFPSDLQHALIRVRELIRRSNNKKFKSFEEALEELKAIDADFEVAINDIKRKYPNEFSD